MKKHRFRQESPGNRWKTEAVLRAVRQRKNFKKGFTYKAFGLYGFPSKRYQVKTVKDTIFSVKEVFLKMLIFINHFHQLNINH